MTEYPPNKKVLIIIKQNNVEKRLFSIEPNSLGELRISFPPSSYKGTISDNTLEGFWNNKEEKCISQMYFSVHNSPQSSENNLIKLTKYFGDGSKQEERNFSKSCKLNNGFTPIYSRVFGSLYGERYIPKKGNKIKIGDYNPKYQSFLYTIFISNKENKFDFNVPEISFLDLDIGKYKVSILYSYVNVIMGSNFCENIVITKPDREDLTYGINQKKCMMMHLTEMVRNLWIQEEKQKKIEKMYSIRNKLDVNKIRFFKNPL